MPKDEWESTRIRGILKKHFSEGKYNDAPSGIEGAGEEWLEIIFTEIAVNSVRRDDNLVIVSFGHAAEHLFNALDFFRIESTITSANNPRHKDVLLDEENLKKLFYLLYQTSQNHKDEEKRSEALDNCKKIAEMFFPERDVVAERKGNTDHPNIAKHRPGGRE